MTTAPLLGSWIIHHVVNVFVRVAGLTRRISVSQLPFTAHEDMVCTVLLLLIAPSHFANWAHLWQYTVDAVQITVEITAVSSFLRRKETFLCDLSNHWSIRVERSIFTTDWSRKRNRLFNPLYLTGECQSPQSMASIRSLQSVQQQEAPPLNIAALEYRSIGARMHVIIVREL